MAKFFDSLQNTVLAGIALVVVYILITRGISMDHNWFAFLFRWLHVLSGIMWIGLLYYFNFVQIPSVPKIPAEQRPAISKVIAPEALFWFRWAALATVVTGLILALMNGYFAQAIVLGIGSGVMKNTAIGIGMWLGLIMAFNVWFLIWPNQQKALGLVEADDATKAKAAATAKLFSRINTMLSVPMLFAMVGAQNIF
ncbi:MAG: urate hydroxylase PuuD [Alphaproteobacteria bacterium]|nr:urate hydroxylase PuuD [Alphaproteobacteria bacterium]